MPGGGDGLFVSDTDIPETSVGCMFEGPRVATDVKAAATGANTVFEGPQDVILRFIVGDRRISYGPYANDPLDELRVNAEIRYNRAYDRFEIWSLRHLYAHEEIFIAYGADFWYHHRGSIPLGRILYAYPAVADMIKEHGDPTSK